MDREALEKIKVEELKESAKETGEENERTKKQKAREVKDAAASAEKNEEEKDKIKKQKAREVTDAAASAKKNVQENDKIMKRKAREVTDAAASAKKNVQENDKIMKRKAREVTDAAASAKKNVQENEKIMKQKAGEVKIEVAAIFPLSQAQRGELVAPSLNLPQTHIKEDSMEYDSDSKDETTEDKFDEHYPEDNDEDYVHSEEVQKIKGIEKEKNPNTRANKKNSAHFMKIAGRWAGDAAKSPVKANKEGPDKTTSNATKLAPNDSKKSDFVANLEQKQNKLIEETKQKENNKMKMISLNDQSTLLEYNILETSDLNFNRVMEKESFQQDGETLREEESEKIKYVTEEADEPELTFGPGSVAPLFSSRPKTGLDCSFVFDRGWPRPRGTTGKVTGRPQ